jgi:hypothetical protein
MWSWTPAGARHQDRQTERQTDWPTDRQLQLGFGYHQFAISHNSLVNVSLEEWRVWLLYAVFGHESAAAHVIFGLGTSGLAATDGSHIESLRLQRTGLWEIIQEAIRTASSQAGHLKGGNHVFEFASHSPETRKYNYLPCELAVLMASCMIFHSPVHCQCRDSMWAAFLYRYRWVACGLIGGGAGIVSADWIALVLVSREPGCKWCRNISWSCYVVRVVCCLLSCWSCLLECGRFP